MKEDDQQDYGEEIEEIQETLKQHSQLLEQNNRIVRKMYKSIRRSQMFRMLYWALIIGSMLGIYYYLQPYIQGVSGAYEELISVPEKLKVWGGDSGL